MTPRSRHRAFGVLKHMSKRELRALVGAKDPASPSLEPEAEGEAEGSDESIMISDLRFSLGRRVRLISFLRHIGEPARISIATLVAIATLLCWQSSSSILPPIFRFSHTLALIASYWGPDFVWVIVLYCGYKLRKLLEKCRY